MNSFAPALPRRLEGVLAGSLRHFPVVVLTGARQTGKTTLVGAKTLAKGRVFRSLDDFEVLERARKQPDALLQDGERLTLDEVQRVPELLLAIKRDVDRARLPGRFLLTGSANLLLMRRVSESLAGRAVYHTLGPMSESEKAGRKDASPWAAWLEAEDVGDLHAPEAAPAPTWGVRAVAGGYPVPALTLEGAARAQWFDGYVRTYLERDLQDIAAITSLADFRRLMRLAALRVGQVLNQSHLARDAALAQATAHRYLNLLEASCQIVRIPAFATSRTKRLVKTPKLYWTDTGLGAHMAGLESSAKLAGPAAGAWLENLVLTQILAWRETVVPRPDLHYWRTHSGSEVDFVLEAGRRLLPLEVKSTTRLRPADAAGLSAFLDEHPRAAPVGIVLYGGKERVVLTERIVGLPLEAAWT